MKKFLIKLFIILSIIAILCVSFCIVIDPYNVFHPLNLKDNGVEPNKNYIKTKYILENPDKYDAFIFGSSRVGNIHGNKIWGTNTYNMTYSEGTPHENLQTLKVFIKNGIIPKKIFIGVDSLSYTIDWRDHLTQQISIPYEVSQKDPFNFWRYYFDPAVVFEALTSIMLDYTEDTAQAYRFYQYGWCADYGDHDTTYDFSHVYPSISGAYLMDECLNDIKEIIDVCNQYGIKVTFFTHPMIDVTYEASLEKNYYEFLRRLADITEFCNFSGYNSITTDYSNWSDNSHYSAEVSDMVLECACFHAYYPGLYEEGFGQWVNKDNVEDIINLLEEKRTEYKEMIEN